MPALALLAAAFAALPAALAAFAPAIALGAAAKPAAEAAPTAAALREDAAADAEGAVRAGDRLRRLAEQGRLSDDLAAVAAELLSHADPFARGLAEWALATRVGRDNRGETARWPRDDAPAWFAAYMAVPPETLIDCDYVRQAAAWNIQQDPAGLAASADKILGRARGAAEAALSARVSPDAGASPQTRALVTRQLAALEALRDRLAAALAAQPPDLAAARGLWLEMRRAARPVVLAHPALDFRELVYVTQHPGHSLQNITGSQYPWAHKPGGDLCVQATLDPAAPVRGMLAGRLGPGHVHGMDLWWDAGRIVFAWARQEAWPPEFNTVEGNESFRLRTSQTPTHLYEVRTDGSALRQLTSDPVWSDFEPTYAPDGRIVFASDRSGRSSECGNFRADHTVINLYACGPDGQGVRRLNDNKDIDRHPHTLDTGQVAYTRWDYQERHFFETHAVWTVNPDGTAADAVFNQHLVAPFGLRDTRSVPGSRLLICVATGHHTLAYGPLVLIDPAVGINTAQALRVLTPDVRPQEGPTAGRPAPEGGVRDGTGVWQTPWALAPDAFLASFSWTPQPASHSDETRKSWGFAVYFIDSRGNKELVARDRVLSCVSPVPLRPRPRPPIIPDATDPAVPWATCYVTDVYEGMTGVERGRVKFLRICQRVGWPLDAQAGARRWIPGNAWERQFGFWSWAPVRVIGTVPVSEDGSAAFKVPADAAIYFQALDERHMELYRMRSHVTLQQGERRGCRGCHETQPAAPLAAVAVPAALASEPALPTPPPWGNRRLLGYEWLVQPVLDKHCVRCHGGASPKGGLDFTATRASDGFLQSFRTMFGLKAGETKPTGRVLVSVSDRLSGSSVTKPLQFGSHKSVLIRNLIESAEHKKEVRLCGDEWLALVTWVDTNAPYYDTFYNRRPEGGGPPRRDFVLDLPDPFGPVARTP
jgi:hypothetical protein